MKRVGPQEMNFEISNYFCKGLKRSWHIYFFKFMILSVFIIINDFVIGEIKFNHDLSFLSVLTLLTKYKSSIPQSLSRPVIV